MRAPDVSEEDAQQLETVAARNGVPVPTTSEQAEIFMQSIMGIRLWESDGSGRGETEGEVVGYNTLSGDNYGGSLTDLYRLELAQRLCWPRAGGRRRRRARASVGARDPHAQFLPDDRRPMIA